METTDLTPIVQRLDALSVQLSQVVEHQRAHGELFADMTPIAREAIATATIWLDSLEKQGYFAFATELARVGQRVVEDFSADDVRQLADAIGSILDVVRSLTRPEVLRIATDATAALRDVEHTKPLGIFRAVRATRDDDVKKGIGVLVDVLRRVGHGVNALAEPNETKALGRKAKLAELLGPRRSRNDADHARKLLPGPAARVTAKPPSPTTPAATDGAAIGGVALRSDGHLADPSAWSRPLAETLAKEFAITLDAQRWALIDAARADFATTHASPNILRLTQVAHVTTKDLYHLFPKAPARTIAKLAGLPKPVGCL